MKKLFMITLLITSVYLLLNTEEPIEILPRIAEKQENVPLLVKPNRVYKTEVSPWDKMFARVKQYESFKSEAYRCSGGVMTIGYGHTKNVKWGDTITEAEALKLLEEELLVAKNHVLRIVKVPLTENQLASLTSFTFNCGQGSLRKLVCEKKNRLNNGNYKSVEVVMPQYRMAAGKIRKGLERRRKWEVSLWLDKTL
jgi:lysozyme